MANNATDLANLAILTANTAVGLAQAAFNAANTSNVAPGQNQSVIFNDYNSYGGSDQFTFNKDSNTLKVSKLEVGPGSLNVATSITAGGDIKPLGQGQDLGRVTSRWYNVYVDGGIYASGTFGKQGQVLTSDGFGTVNWIDPVVSANGQIGTQFDTYTRNLVNTTNIVANTALVLAQQANAAAQQALAISNDYVIATGGPAVAGENQSIQFNDNGRFGANSEFNYNKQTGTISAKKLNIGPGQLNVAARIYTGGDVLPYTQGLNLGSASKRFYNVFMDGGVYTNGTFGTPDQVLVSAEYGTIKWKNVSEIIANASNFTVPVTDDVARQLIIRTSIELNTAITLAQAAYDNANSAINRSLPVDDYSRNTANSALDLSHSSFDQSNNAYTIVNILQDRLNSQNAIVINAGIQAQQAFQQSLSATAAFEKANATNLLAQAAFNRSNTIYNQSFSIISSSQAAFNQANAAGVFSQNAYRVANTALDRTLVVGALAQEASDRANASITLIQSAFNQANTGTELAQAAFVQANTASANTVYTQGVDNTQNTNITAINTFAAAAYAQANTGTTLAQAAFDAGNTAAILVAGIDATQNTNITATNTFVASAYAQANTGTTLAQAAFDAGNTASALSAGINATQNTNITATNTFAASAYGQANTGTTLAQAAFDAGNNSTALSAGINATQNTNIADATSLASGAYNQANTGVILSQAAFDLANTVLADEIYIQGVINTQNTVIQNISSSLTGSFTPYYYNSSIANTVNSIALGGAPVQSAQVWKTFTVTQVLDTLLFPTINPTYTIPSISLSGNYSGTQEIGINVNQALTITSNKNDAGLFTQLRISRNGTNLLTTTSPTTTLIGNIGAQYGYNDPNNPNYSYTASYTDTYTIPSGTTTWSGSGSYGAGLAKQNNKGVTDTTSFVIRSGNAPQAADSNFGSNNISINGIYPYFWGLSSTQPTVASIAADIQSGTTNKVLSAGSGTLTITYNASSQYVWFAVQSGYGNKSTWYNTALNNGSIGTGQFILSPVSQSVTSPSGYWSGVTYNIYISGYATTTSGSLQFS